MSKRRRKEVRGRFRARHDPEKMKFELERRKTFKSWSETCPIQPGPLAEAGFYYVGIMDRVKCFSCLGEIDDWKDGDTAMGEHATMSPNCDMVKNMERRNVPITEQLNEIRSQRADVVREEADGHIIVEMTKIIHLMTSKDLVNTPLETSFAGKLPHAKHPLYTKELERLKTFRIWPADSELPFSDLRWLANAGFLYTGPGDRARCFFCNGGIEFWEVDDEPWSEHAKNFPTCEWLIEMKGKAFVDEVQNAKVKEEAKERTSKERLTAPTQSANCRQASSLEASQSEDDTKETSSKLVEMMGSPTVKMILKTGFDEALLYHVLDTQMRERDLDFTSSDIFIKALRAAEKQKDSVDGTPVESFLSRIYKSIYNFFN